MDFIFDNFDVDYHDFELMRGDYKNKDLFLPPLEAIQKTHDFIIRNRRRYLKRRKANLLEAFANISLLNLSQAIKERHISDKRPIYTCAAGRNIGVIDANGDIRLCELLPPVGNVRDAGYDFYAVRNSKTVKEREENIEKSCCACTHVCFIKLTASSYLKTLPYPVYYYLTMRHDK